MKVWRLQVPLFCSLLLLTSFNLEACAAEPPAIIGAVHLLVVIPQGPQRLGKSALVAQLAKLPSRGWLISVMRVDGTFTPYLPPQQIAAALHVASPSANAPEPPHQANEAEVRKLAAFSGRRILLVLKSKAQSAASPTFGAAVQAQVPVYLVDGGEKYNVTNRAVWGFSFEPSGTIDDSSTKRQRYLRDGIVHEIDLPKAIRHIASDPPTVLLAGPTS